ncbi:MAG: hypothetical protein HC861_11205, partial [Rhodospirillaceae bacterium]|nr:hypothetical protein [Rhodospirillaceae bacterium]
GMTVTVLNPVMEDVNNLYQSWRKAAVDRAQTIPNAPLEAFDKIAGVQVDSGATLLKNDGCRNQAVDSIASHAFLFSFTGRTFIHGGDACSWQIENGLRAAGLTAPDGSFKADAMLVPYQGSDRNVTPEFFRRIKADHYLFTGNGRHSNPESATLRMILEARRGDIYWFEFVNPQMEKRISAKSWNAFFAEFPSSEYGYRRVFRSSVRVP